MQPLSLNGNHQQNEGGQPLLMDEESEKLVWPH